VCLFYGRAPAQGHTRRAGPLWGSPGRKRSHNPSWQRPQTADRSYSIPALKELFKSASPSSLVTDPVLQPAINPMINTVTTIARDFDCIEPPSGRASELPIIIIGNSVLFYFLRPASKKPNPKPTNRY